MSAQGQLPTRSIHAAPRSVGTWHAATNTWTRTGGATAFGPDVLYNNTGPSSYYVVVSDQTITPFEITDSGRIPSLSDVGDGDLYTVDGFQFGYCSAWNGGPTLSLRLRARNAYAPCTAPAASWISQEITITGLPSSSGAQACWIVSIDLAGSTDLFTLDGDADGFFDGSAALDNFGLSVALSGHGTDATTGPILFGDPVASPFGDGTSQFGFGPGPDGTGLGQQDAFWIQTPSLAGPRCYNFGSYPANAGRAST